MWPMVIVIIAVVVVAAVYCCCLCIVPIVVATDVAGVVGSLNESSPWQHEARTLAHTSGQNNRHQFWEHFIMNVTNLGSLLKKILAIKIIT